MSSDCIGYLKIGDIKGNSMDENHQEWIEILSISHSASRNINPTSKPKEALSTSQVHMAAIDVQKKADQSSPELVTAVAAGRTFDKCTVDLVKTTEDGTVVYYQWVLDHAYIANYGIHSSHTGGGVRTLENISICSSKMQWIYTPTAEDNTQQGPVDIAWDMNKNKLA